MEALAAMKSTLLTQARHMAGCEGNRGGKSMRITMDDGVELAVEVAGDGPGLLLVHGFGGAKEDFADHVAALAATHTVVVFDHRGHGASDKPADLAAYSLDRLRADTLAVADAVGLDGFRLLGHSMGGRWRARSRSSIPNASTR
jgi:pimeloyl-ACP methyl ester carboxylesterase